MAWWYVGTMYNRTHHATSTEENEAGTGKPDLRALRVDVEVAVAWGIGKSVPPYSIITRIECQTTNKKPTPQDSHTSGYFL